MWLSISGVGMGSRAGVNCFMRSTFMNSNLICDVITGQGTLNFFEHQKNSSPSDPIYIGI